MSAYFLFDVREITDEAKMVEYREKVFPVVAQYGGKYQIIGGAQHVLEGNWDTVFPVLIEFEDVQKAHNWYDSSEYKELKALRLAATKGNMVLLDGAINALAQDN